jgi:hypothetical protein
MRYISPFFAAPADVSNMTIDKILTIMRFLVYFSKTNSPHHPPKMFEFKRGSYE